MTPCPVCAYWQDRIASTDARIEQGSVLVAYAEVVRLKKDLREHREKRCLEQRG